VTGWEAPRPKTARLALRRLRPDDAANLFRTVGDADVMRYWAPGPDATIAATAQRIAEIEAHWDAQGFGDWGVVERETGALIGFAGLHYITGMPEVNVGYAFEQSRWGRGYATEVCRALIAHGFERLRLPEIVAVIAPQNRASIRVAEKSGLVFWKRFEWSGQDRVAYRITRTAAVAETVNGA
jgi:[ribosomal protein S5]-alanine N-acetyltransferase